jgi:hypothetical protein
LNSISLKARTIFYATALAVCFLIFWFTRLHHDTQVDKQTASTTLGPNDQTKIIIDQKHHTITRVDLQKDGSESVKKSYLNPHGPVSVAEEKSGNTIIVQRTWGTEINPAVGLVYGSDFTLRAAGSLQLFYIQRWEAGLGVAMGSQLSSTRAFASVSYNVYNNILVGAYLDNHRDAGVICSIRF